VNQGNRTVLQIIIAVAIGIAMGCICGAVVLVAMAVQPNVLAALTQSPTPTMTRAVASPLPTITLRPPSTPTTPITPIPSPPPPTPIATATDGTSVPPRTPIVTRASRIVARDFLMARPVAPNAPTTHPALTYLYGTTSGGTYDVHHGEEFVNPTGTPLYAVADGTVVVAGNDSRRMCGDDGKRACGRDINFYGNVVVIRLTRTLNDQPVFALYGHMNRINVAEGASVKQGDVIGEIGATGIAQGPHVHFEVRVGANDYAHTRNPILWMTPQQGRGALAGRYADSKGNLMRGAIIGLSRAEPENFLYSVETYSRDDAPPVNSDDELDENFAFPDLTPGDYIVRVSNQQYAARVTIQAGKLSFVEIGGP
jgi:murein DD-endopeptidase MepM/ murein hydrolase activator NlpD